VHLAIVRVPAAEQLREGLELALHLLHHRRRVHRLYRISEIRVLRCTRSLVLREHRRVVGRVLLLLLLLLTWWRCCRHLMELRAAITLEGGVRGILGASVRAVVRERGRIRRRLELRRWGRLELRDPRRGRQIRVRRIHVILVRGLLEAHATAGAARASILRARREALEGLAEFGMQLPLCRDRLATVHRVLARVTIVSNRVQV